MLQFNIGKAGTIRLLIILLFILAISITWMWYGIRLHEIDNRQQPSGNQSVQNHSTLTTNQ